MRKCLVLLSVCIYSLASDAQNVGIGVPNPQNKLHVGGGFRLDTLTGVGGAGLVRHDANGVVYGIKFTGNVSDVLRGDGTFGSGGSGSVGWLLNGNSGTNPATHFIGTTDNQPLIFRVNNIRHGYLGNSIFLGSNAGFANIAGENIGIGERSLYSNNSNANTALGIYTLEKNTFGTSNIAIGNYALKDNIDGSYNVGIGYLSLGTNTAGIENTAVGNYSLRSNTTGYNNTAVGSSSLLNNNGYFNSAHGAFSLNGNTTGHDNTALGYSAMRYNRTTSFNTSVGAFSLYSNTIGMENTAVGYKALFQNIGQTQASGSPPGGHWNTAVGNFALYANTQGFRNTAIGYAAGSQLPNEVYNVTVIGYETGWNTTSTNQVNIGNFSQTWIGGQTGWFHYSDKRIKNDIKDDVPGLLFITRLKPITYHVDIDKQEEIANTGKIETNSELIKPVQKNWEGKYDVEKIKMTGFFAQDVEEAAKSINYSFNGIHNPKNGGLYSLDYSAFVVPLVKAVQEQQAIIDRQQKQIDDLIKRIEALEKK